MFQFLCNISKKKSIDISYIFNFFSYKHIFIGWLKKQECKNCLCSVCNRFIGKTVFTDYNTKLLIWAAAHWIYPSKYRLVGLLLFCIAFFTCILPLKSKNFEKTI